jgi:exonuclease III
MIKQEWGNEVFINSGASNRSKGLMFLISKKFKQYYEKITVVHSDDRIFIIRIEENKDKAFLWANIYAPCISGEKVVFFQQALDIIKKIKDTHENEPLVCMGDFNCVLNNELDIISGEKHPVAHLKEFNNFIINLNLYDIWRMKNDQCKESTWRRWNIARRLDYILLD